MEFWKSGTKLRKECLASSVLMETHVTDLFVAYLALKPKLKTLGFALNF